MFEPLAIGNWTLNADVSDDSRTRNTSGTMGVNAARGSRVQNVTAPSAMTKMMYHRPRGGRSRSKTPQVYFFPNEDRPWQARTAAEVRPARPGGGVDPAR